MEVLYFQFFLTAYNPINFFINFCLCLTEAWKIIQCFFFFFNKSQTVISIFPRLDVEKYLKFKIQKFNKKWNFF